MADIIDTAPSILVLTSARANQWSKEWLFKTIKKSARDAGIREELRLFDARGVAATRLILADATIPEMAHHTGAPVATAAEMVERDAALDISLTDTVLGETGCRPR